MIGRRVTENPLRWHGSSALWRSSMSTSSSSWSRFQKHFVRYSDLGFSIEEIRNLLRLWGDTARASADVKALTESHIAELDKKIALMGEMRQTLASLAEACDGDHRPDCPIIATLAGNGGHHH